MKIAIRKVLLTSPRASQNPMRVIGQTGGYTSSHLLSSAKGLCGQSSKEGSKQTVWISCFAAGQQALELPPRSLQWREVVHRGKTFSDLWGLSPWEDLLLRKLSDLSGLPLGEGLLLGELLRELLLCFWEAGLRAQPIPKYIFDILWEREIKKRSQSIGR